MDKRFDRPDATLEEAIQAGYKCGYPDCKPRGLSSLCGKLGPGYHLASFNELPGCEKDIVIQRVVGGGYDVEIYNYHRGRCIVVLWADYGCRTVRQLRNVPSDTVENRIREMVAADCPPDVSAAFLK